MKKGLLFALLVALLAPWATRAQEELTICNGTSTDGYVPFYGYWADYDQHAQLVYPADSLENLAGSSISSVSFYANSATSYLSSGTFVIKMGELGSFSGFASSQSSLLDNSGFTTVYSGTLSLGSGNVMKIEFDEPYTYGGEHLVIDINYTHQNSSSYGYMYFYGVSTSYNDPCWSYNRYGTSNYSCSRIMPKATFEYSASGSSICRAPGGLTISDITESEATLSWTPRGDEEEWMVYLDGEEVEAVSTTTYTFTDMSPSSNHTVGVRAVCDEDDSSRIVTASFFTACAMLTQDDLPIFDDFDSYANDGAIHPCWNRINLYTSGSYNYPAPYGSPGGRSGKSLYAYNGTGQLYSYLILPAVSDLNGLMVSVDYYVNSTGWQLQVGTMTDPTDATTFVPFATTPTSDATGTWYELEAVVPENTEANYAAIRSYGNGDCSGYYDNVMLMVAPACMRPNGIAVSNITAQTATLTINDPTENGNYHVFYAAAGSTDTTFLDVTSDLVIDLEELVPNTQYYVGVYTECEGGTYTRTVGNQFRTECGSVSTLPWTDNFESYTTEQAPTCYTRMNTGSSSQNYLKVYNYYANSGSKCLYFNYVNGTNTIMLPDFDVDISGLELSFWHRPESTTNAYCGTLQVGYVTDPTDASTFVPTASFAYNDFTSATYRQDEAYFADAPEGARIAIRHVGTGSSNWYWVVDDLDLHVAPACTKPSVVVSNVTDEGADLSINDANGLNVYRIYIAGRDTIAVNANEYSFDDLTPSTSYELKVFTVCDDGSLSQPATVSFHTECAEMQLPYHVSFASTVDQCWNNPNGMTITSSEQAVYTGGSNGRLVSPYIPGGLADKMVRINWRSYSNGGGYAAQVGIGDASGQNVTWLETVPDDGTYHETLVMLSQYTGTENHLVIGGGGGYSYVRSVDIEVLNGCLPVEGLHASEVTANGATIEWNEPEDATGYIVEYRTANGAWTAVTDFDGTTATLSDLQPITDYTVRVRTICTNDTSYSVSTTFTTICAAEDFPWHFTQADMLAVQPTNVGFTRCWDWNTFWRDSQNGVGYVYSYAVGNEFRLPPVDVDLSTAQLRTLVATTASSAKFMVGVREGNTTVWLDTIACQTTANSTTGVYYEVPLTAYTGTANRVVVGNVTGDYIYHLDFHVEPISSCPAVRSLHVSSVLDTTATIAWTAGGDETEWFVSIDGGEEFAVSETSYSIPDLTANTLHSASVRAVCGEGDTASTRDVSFRTACGIVHSENLPLTQDFEAYTSSQQEIDCWTRISSWSYPQISTANSTTIEDETVGGKVYYSYTYTTGDEIFFVTPPIESLAGLEASCFIYQISPGSQLAIGVMTDPNDPSTFQQLVMENATGGWQKLEAVITGIEDIEDYHYVGFRQTMNSGTGGLYIDNIYIGVATTCPKPQNLVCTSTSEDGLSFSWTAASEDATYEVVYSTTGGDEQTLTTTETSVELTDLEGSTAYDVKVRAICSDEESSRWVLGTFRTSCGSISNLPWRDNFDSYSNLFTSYTSSIVGNVFPCYDALFCSSSAILSMTNSSYRYGSTGFSAFFYPGAAYRPNFLILPPMEQDISGLQLSFYTQCESGTYSGTFAVGYITNANDSTTFVPTLELDAADYTSVFSQVTATFEGAPAGARIALRHISNQYNYYWFFDELVVSEAGDNPQPVGIDAATAAPVRLYPNPATSSVSVEFEGVATVSLLDLSGRQVMVTEADSRATFNVSSLAKGAYFVRVTSAAGTAVSKLVVK